MIMKEWKKSLDRKNDNNGNVNNDKLYLIDLKKKLTTKKSFTKIK